VVSVLLLLESSWSIAFLNPFFLAKLAYKGRVRVRFRVRACSLIGIMLRVGIELGIGL
jgi:hypothetical protein